MKRITKLLTAVMLCLAMAVQGIIPIYAQEEKRLSDDRQSRYEEKVLFEDNFEDDAFRQEWEFNSSGEYILEKDASAGTQVFRIKGVPWDGKAYVHIDEQEWKNYSVEMEFVINGWLNPGSGMAPYDCVGLVGRKQSGQHLAFFYRRASKTLELNKSYRNAGHVLGSVSYPLEEHTKYKMKLEISGNRFSAYIAEKNENYGAAVLNYVDDGTQGPILDYGGAGIEVGGADVSIDDFKVAENDGSIPVESISLDKDEMLLEKGKKETLQATVLPITASDKTMTWTSSDTTVATVDENGNVTGVGQGTAQISVAANQNSDIIAVCKIEVYETQKCKTFYYVSPNGSDDNEGSEEKPFATIQKARDTIRALGGNIPNGGVIVYLREGEYYQEETLVFTAEDSGKPGSPIVYTSYPGEKAVITGGQDIVGWERLEGEIPYMADAAKGNLYVADIEKGWRFHDLYVDGERQQVSQQMETIQFRNWPQFSGKIGEENSKFLEVNPDKGIKVKFNDGELDGLTGNPDIELNCMTVMFWNALPIVTEINEEENTAYLYSYNPCNFGFGKDCFNSGPGGWYSILNDIKYLDRPGEWCVDSREGKVYYWPKDNSFTKARTIAPKPYELIRFQGDEEEQNWEKQVKYIVLDHLTMEYTDRLPESRFDEYDSIRNVENPDAAIYMQGTEMCKVTNSVIRHTGSYAVGLNHYAQKNEIIGNELSDLGCGGVNLIGYGTGTTDLNKYNKVMYNNIHDLGYAPYLHSAGVTMFQSGENTVSYNFISNSPYAGVTILGTELASFNSNHIGEAWDFFGKTGRQFGMRWNELELNRNYTREESKAYLHSRNNTVEYNIIDEYMTRLEDGGGLYAWGCGYGNKYLNNIIIKTEKGMHWTFPLYMDDEVDRITVGGNRIWSMEQGTVDKGYGSNTWYDNAFSWPEKPEGYDKLYDHIMTTVKNETGGYIVEEIPVAEPVSPENNEDNVDIPVELIWKPVNGASRYTVEIATDANFENVILEQMTKGTSYDIQDLQYAVTYYWRVSAHGWAGAKSVSDVFAFTIKEEGMPSVPKNLTIRSDYDTIMLKWNESLNTTYDIYRKMDSEKEFVKIASGISGGGYLDNTVQPAARYEYYVRGVTGKGESEASEIVEIKTNKTKILFEDNFDQGASEEWVTSTGKPLNVSDGVVHANSLDMGNAFVHAGDTEWVDYAVELDVNFKGLLENAPSWTGFGLITRAVGTGDFNQFVSRGVTGIQEAIMCVGGRNWTYFGSEPAFDFTKNEWHKMRVEHKDDMMYCFVDHQLIFELEDTGFKPYGGAGFGFIYEIADADNFRVIAQDDSTLPSNPVKKELLQKTYDYASALSTDGVADSAKTFFEKALANAKEVLDSETATQEEVDAAWARLLNGIWGLGIVKGDTTILEMLIDRADAMVAEQDRYVQGNWQQLVDALTAAKDVLCNGDALEEDVQPAEEALLNAILAQRYKANKDNLKGLIDKAEGLDLSKYTKESVAAFKAALKNATVVMADESLADKGQAKVDKAAEGLLAAIDGLKLASNDGDMSDKDAAESSSAINGITGNRNADKNAPKTGDNMNVAVWLILMAVIAVAGGVSVKSRRKS